MPIYEYRCSGCNEVFEVFQGHRDPPPARHHCGGTEVVRVLSRTSFRLVGAGWYQSDYGSRPKEAGDSEGGGERSAADKGSDGPKKEGSEPASSGSTAPGSSAPEAGRGSAKGTGAAPPPAAATAKAGSGRAKGSDRAG